MDEVAAGVLRTSPCTAIDQVDEVVAARGDAASCWCQWDRLPNRLFRTAEPDELHDRLDALITGPGPSPGVVASIEGVHVGWCSVAPRQQFARARTSPSMTTADLRHDDPDVWAVTCFVVHPAFRRRGVARALLDAAVDHARSGGGLFCEGYPIDTAAASRRSSADLYRGTLSLFLAAGFEVVARPRPSRVIVRREL